MEYDPFGIIGGSKESLDQLIQSGCIGPPGVPGTSGWPSTAVQPSAAPSPKLKRVRSAVEKKTGGGPPKSSASVESLPLDICDSCGGLVNLRNGTYQCSECGKMSEVEFVPEVTTNQQIGLRMRIVGPENRYFQRGLDSMASGDYGEIQKQTVLNEFMNYNRIYVFKGGDGFAQSVIQKAADIYHEIQKRIVKRDQQKVMLMGACLKRACIESGFSRPERDIIDCVGLRSGGLTKGEDLLRSMASNGEIKIEFDNFQEYDAQVTTVLATAGIFKDKHEKYELFRDMIIDFVKIAEDHNIANSSLLKTKTVGSAYIILAHHGSDIAFGVFCANCKIRTNTVKKFLMAADQFHSKFMPIYEKYGLESRRPTEFPTIKKIFAPRGSVV